MEIGRGKGKATILRDYLSGRLLDLRDSDERDSSLGVEWW